MPSKCRAHLARSSSHFVPDGSYPDYERSAKNAQVFQLLLSVPRTENSERRTKMAGCAAISSLMPGTLVYGRRTKAITAREQRLGIVPGVRLEEKLRAPADRPHPAHRRS